MLELDPRMRSAYGPLFLERIDAGEDIFGPPMVNEKGHLIKDAFAALLTGHFMTHEVDSTVTAVTEDGQLWINDGGGERRQRVESMVAGTANFFGIPDVILALEAEAYLKGAIDPQILASQLGTPS